MTTPRRPVAIVLAVLALPPLTACARSSAKEDVFEGLGLRVEGASSFQVDSSFVTPGVPDGRTVVAHEGEAIVRVAAVGGLSPAAAEARIREQVKMLQSVFAPSLPPYPEYFTKETGCPSQYLPEAHPTQLGTYYLLYAGDRLGYGVCNADLVRFRAGVGFFHCAARQRVLKVEYFVPAQSDPERITRFFGGLACLGAR